MTRCLYLAMFLAMACFAANVRAELLSVKLTGSNQPSCWSIEDIVSEVTAGIDSDREKALALHNFGMKHQIHFIGPFEGGMYVHDALKLLSVYGYNLCGNNSAAMCALYETAGLKARRRGGTGHVIPEVWFDDKWNYIDTDMFGYVYLPDDERIASFDELVDNPDLFARAGRRPEPYYPWDPPQAMMKAFIDPPGWTDYHGYSLAHMMRLELRTGEKLTCYYRPRDRFYIDPESLPRRLTTVYRDYWEQGPVRAASMAWTDTVPAAYGNARFEYEPDLRSEAFRRENPPPSGVKVATADDKPPLVAAATGRPAQVTVAVRSPWVIEGLQNDLTNFDDNTDGAVVEGWFWRLEPGDENSIAVSVDGGRSWTRVWENTYMGAVPFEVDLTRFVHGRYSYLVRFEWTDNAGTGRVGLQGLKLDTWAELSPMSLPRLEPGENEFDLSVGNHRANIVNCFWREGESLPGQRLDNLVVVSGEDHRLRPLNPDAGSALVFAPGVDGMLDGIRLGFHLSAAEGYEVHDVRAALSLSTNGGSTWRNLREYEAHPEHDLGGMWLNHVLDGESMMGDRALLKLSLNHAEVHTVQYSALERRNQSVPSELEVTHAYLDSGGNLQEVSWSFPPGAQSTSYTVEVPQRKIYNHSLTYEAVAPEGR